MIRILTELDRLPLMTYLEQEPSINNFIIGDIEQFGFSTDFIFTYGEFDEENNYLSVLLFYRESAIFYSKLKTFNEDWLEIFNQHQFAFLSGKKQVIDLLAPYFKTFTKKEMFFAEAKELTKSKQTHHSKIELLSTEEHCTLLYDLLSNIDEFSIKGKDKDKFIEEKMSSLKMSMTYFIVENNEMISTVAATAESSVSAVVVGVATKEIARMRGFATELMVHLMDQYINEKGKILCLFYDNPNAGNIYKRLGFKDIDKWVMMSKE